MSYQPTPTEIERDYFERKLSGFIDYLYSDLKKHGGMCVSIRYKHFTNSEFRCDYKKGSLKYKSATKLYRRFPEELYELVNQKLTKGESINLKSMTDIPIKSYLPDRPERLFKKIKRDIDYYTLLQHSDDFLEYKKLLLEYYFFNYNNFAFKVKHSNRKVSTRLGFHYMSPDKYSFDLRVSF